MALAFPNANALNLCPHLFFFHKSHLGPITPSAASANASATHTICQKELRYAFLI